MPHKPQAHALRCALWLLCSESPCRRSSCQFVRNKIIVNSLGTTMGRWGPSPAFQMMLVYYYFMILDFSSAVFLHFSWGSDLSFLSFLSSVVFLLFFSSCMLILFYGRFPSSSPSFFSLRAIFFDSSTPRCHCFYPFCLWHMCFSLCCCDDCVCMADVLFLFFKVQCGFFDRYKHFFQVHIYFWCHCVFVVAFFSFSSSFVSLAVIVFLCLLLLFVIPVPGTGYYICFCVPPCCVMTSRSWHFLFDLFAVLHLIILLCMIAHYIYALH
eukprot:GCRY01004764.1.p1 GENE.GCRY01004764.1~~GCRY01004764.1.p1  ORF type:complete len:268 (+),score=14.76 GCRY01004764.1:454-1257(+)